MKITESKTYIAVPPGFTIKEMMEDQGKSLQEFAHLMGLSEDDAAALIEGEAQLTDAVAGRLEIALGMDAQFWVNLEHLYREDLIKVAAENAQDETKMFKHSKTYMAIPPGATIKEMIDDRGISEAQLAASLGESEAFVQKLIEGETELTADLAARLAALLGMNTRFWLGLERGYREDLAKVAAENAQDAKTEQTEASSRVLVVEYGLEAVKVIYRTRALQKVCTDFSAASRKYGYRMTELILKRIEQIQYADDVERSDFG